MNRKVRKSLRGARATRSIRNIIIECPRDSWVDNLKFCAVPGRNLGNALWKPQFGKTP